MMFVHGDNIASKMGDSRKYNDDISKAFLAEIKEEYDKWKAANLSLQGPFAETDEHDMDILKQRVDYFNQYKDFIDQQHYAENFDSRSNLHSSVLEEFMYYLFKDLVGSYSSSALIGKSHSFKDIFFMPKNYSDMVKKPHARIEKKDHDFVIGAKIIASMHCAGNEQAESIVIEVPAVAIECKTYLDKTMLEGSSTAGAQLLTRNPNALYIVVAEWLKLTESVNLKKYQVDQIYVLRKQRNTDREYRFLPGYEKKPVHLDVVVHLFNSVRSHLSADWEGGVSFGLERGFLI
ncbi:MAG: Bpu10I family restriction endonuclease [Oscillospiraceae bacterium]|nr:Bpu10I family restriction endonuclease [Oscillospiraceae bacterium]